MKNANIYLFCMTVLLTLFFVGCGTIAPSPSTNSASGGDTVPANGHSSGMDMDAAIREAATEMEAKIPSKTMVALVSVASPSTAFSTQVLTRLESAIVSSGKLVVVDRANLDKVRAEQGFQLSGEVDDESAKSIGKLLGAGAIVTGTLTDLGDVYSLSLKAINIETATVAVSYLADLAKTTRIETMLASGGGADMASTGGARPPRAVQPSAPVKIYQIGDTGPAGGIVFHDKGAFTNGWRYLESAPEDIVPVQWGTLGVDVAGTSAATGTGSANTERIAAALEQRGEDGAALFCAVLELNGYTDWFLPSYGELDLLRKNLKLKGLGNLGNGLYWSSSQHTGNAWLDGQRAFAQRFSDGASAGDMLAGGAEKTRVYSVRAIRQF